MKSSQLKKSPGVSRRTFVRGAATVAGGLLIVPSHVLGRDGEKPPSEKVNIAAIGTGGQGASDLSQLESENIVAICDVDKRRATEVAKRYPKAMVFTDYR